MKKIIKSELFIQIIKFGFVGFVAFLIDYLCLIFLKEVVNMNLFIATLLAFSISLFFNYILSVKFVYNVKNKKKNKIIYFIILSVIGLLLTELIMYVGVEVLLISYLIVKIIATIVVMIFNFITRKILLEREK